MLEAFLLPCPVEELGSERRASLDLNNLGDEVRWHPAELVELGYHAGAPLVTVLAEGVDDESSNRREAEGGGEQCLWGRCCGGG